MGSLNIGGGTFAERLITVWFNLQDSPSSGKWALPIDPE